MAFRRDSPKSTTKYRRKVRRTAPQRALPPPGGRAQAEAVHRRPSVKPQVLRRAVSPLRAPDPDQSAARQRLRGRGSIDPRNLRKTEQRVRREQQRAAEREFAREAERRRAGLRGHGAIDPNVQRTLLRRMVGEQKTRRREVERLKSVALDRGADDNTRLAAARALRTRYDVPVPQAEFIKQIKYEKALDQQEQAKQAERDARKIAQDWWKERESGSFLDSLKPELPGRDDLADAGGAALDVLTTAQKLRPEVLLAGLVKRGVETVGDIDPGDIPGAIGDVALTAQKLRPEVLLANLAMRGPDIVRALGKVDELTGDPAKRKEVTQKAGTGLENVGKGLLFAGRAFAEGVASGAASGGKDFGALEGIEDQMKDVLVGIPSSVVGGAVAIGALAKGDTGPADEILDTLVTDYKARYGDKAVENYKSFEKAAEQYGLLPYLFDLGGAKVVLGRGGGLMRPGSRVRPQRPDLEIGPGNIVGQRWSGDIFNRPVQQALDKARTKKTMKKVKAAATEYRVPSMAERMAQRERGISGEGTLPLISRNVVEQRAVLPLVPAAARLAQRVDVSRAVTRALTGSRIDYLDEVHRGIARDIRRLKTLEEKLAFKFMHETGLPAWSHGPQAQATIKKWLNARIALIERERAKEVEHLKEIDEPSPYDDDLLVLNQRDRKELFDELENLRTLRDGGDEALARGFSDWAEAISDGAVERDIRIHVARGDVDSARAANRRRIPAMELAGLAEYHPDPIVRTNVRVHRGDPPEELETDLRNEIAETERKLERARGRHIKPLKEHRDRLREALASIPAITGPAGRFRVDQGDPEIPGVSRENTGVRVGEIRVAESQGRMTTQRHTGHFGTGIYFASSRKAVGADRRQNMSTDGAVHAIDLTDASLFKPRDRERALEIHDFFDELNLLAHGTRKASKQGIDEDVFELGLDTSALTMLGSQAEKLWRKAVADAKADIEAGNGDAETAGTRLMKALGYDGIDTRHIPELDNTEFGSVLYRGTAAGDRALGRKPVTRREVVDVTADLTDDLPEGLGRLAERANIPTDVPVPRPPEPDPNAKPGYTTRVKIENLTHGQKVLGFIGPGGRNFEDGPRVVEEVRDIEHEGLPVIEVTWQEGGKPSIWPEGTRVRAWVDDTRDYERPGDDFMRKQEPDTDDIGEGYERVESGYKAGDEVEVGGEWVRLKRSMQLKSGEIRGYTDKGPVALRAARVEKPKRFKVGDIVHHTDDPIDDPSGGGEIIEVRNGPDPYVVRWFDSKQEVPAPRAVLLSDAEYRAGAPSPRVRRYTGGQDRAAARSALESRRAQLRDEHDALPHAFDRTKEDDARFAEIQSELADVESKLEKLGNPMDDPDYDPSTPEERLAAERRALAQKGGRAAAESRRQENDRKKQREKEYEAKGAIKWKWNSGHRYVDPDGQYSIDSRLDANHVAQIFVRLPDGTEVTVPDADTGKRIAGAHKLTRTPYPEITADQRAFLLGVKTELDQRLGPQKTGGPKIKLGSFKHLRQELEAIASDSLEGVKWSSTLTPDDAARIYAVLRSELEDGGMLTEQHLRDGHHGATAAAINRQAENLLKALEPVRDERDLRPLRREIAERLEYDAVRTLEPDVDSPADPRQGKWTRSKDADGNTVHEQGEYRIWGEPIGFGGSSPEKMWHVTFRGEPLLDETGRERQPYNLTEGKRIVEEHRAEQETPEAVKRTVEDREDPQSVLFGMEDGETVSYLGHTIERLTQNHFRLDGEDDFLDPLQVIERLDPDVRRVHETPPDAPPPVETPRPDPEPEFEDVETARGQSTPVSIVEAEGPSSPLLSRLTYSEDETSIDPGYNISAAAVEEFERLRQVEGLREPGYFPSEAYHDSHHADYVATNTGRAVSPSRQYTGKLWRLGFGATQPEALAHSVAHAIKVRWQYPLVANTMARYSHHEVYIAGPNRFTRDGGPGFVNIEDPGELLSRLGARNPMQAKRLLEEILDAAGRDRKRVGFVNPRIVRSNWTEAEARGETVLRDTEADAQRMHDGGDLDEDNLMRDEGTGADRVEGDLSRAVRTWDTLTPEDIMAGGWRLVDAKDGFIDKGAFQEIVSSMERSGKGMRQWDILKGKQSRLMLGFFNLSWLQFQVAANALATTMSMGPRMIPRLIQEQIWWHNLTPEQRKQFEIETGRARPEVANRQPRLGATAKEMSGPMRRMYGWWNGMKSHPAYDFGARLNPISFLMGLDSRNNFWWGRKVFFDEAARQRIIRMNDNAHHLTRLHNGLSNIWLLKPNEQLRFVFENRKDIEEVTRRTNQMLGDYARYTNFERKVLGRTVMFYGFLRYSLRFTFFTMPTRHPMMTALLANLSRLNVEEIRQFLGGDEMPWGLGKLYYTRGGKLRSVDLARMNPALNQMTQLFTGGKLKPTQALGLLPPVVGIPIEWMFGIDYFTGKAFTADGMAPGAAVATRPGALDPWVGLNQVLGLMAPYRAAEKAFGPTTPQTDASILMLHPDEIVYKDPKIRASMAVEQMKHPKARGLDALAEQQLPLILAVLGKSPPSRDKEIAESIRMREMEKAGNLTPQQKVKLTQYEIRLGPEYLALKNIYGVQKKLVDKAKKNPGFRTLPKKEQDRILNMLKKPYDQAADQIKREYRP
jgi:hypothetical protein